MREFIDGSTAIVRGALDAGCDFVAGYPITPASSILMAMMRELPPRGGVALQARTRSRRSACASARRWPAPAR